MEMEHNEIAAKRVRSVRACRERERERTMENVTGIGNIVFNAVCVVRGGC